MLAGEDDEMYPITYIINLFSSTAPHPQLVQISETLVQLMSFATVFTIWGSGQSCFLWQLRSFSLFFLTTPVGFNSLLCLWDCKLLWPKLHFLNGIYIPTSQDRGCFLSSGMNWKLSANQCQILKIRLWETTTQFFHSVMGTTPVVYHKCVAVVSIWNRFYHTCQREVFPIFRNTVVN